MIKLLNILKEMKVNPQGKINESETAWHEIGRAHV